MELNKYIEHTLLKPDATLSEVKKLLAEALKYKFLGVCVNPAYVRYAKQHVRNKLKVITVIGFPLGQSTDEIKIFEAINAVQNGADEIDMVLNIGKLKDKKYNYIVNEITKVNNFLHYAATYYIIDEISSKKTLSCERKLKVILETDLLNKDEIKKACELCVEAGADFVKTSTGFVKNGAGAKAEDVKLMYETVSPFGLGVKASGGIRDKATALEMIAAGAVRLGTSSGVKIVSE